MGYDLELYIDGACKGNHNKKLVNKAFVCIISKDKRIDIFKDVGEMTNNEAEWEALIEALKIAKSLRRKNIMIYSDSQLVVNQFKNRWRCRDERMKVYYLFSKTFETVMKVDIEWIPRDKNLAGIELERRT